MGIPFFAASFSCRVNASQKWMCQLILCGTDFQFVGTFVEVHTDAEAGGGCSVGEAADSQLANIKS